MWKDLCLNPYENKVQENENGIRRVQISGGWLEEDTTSSIHFCRALTVDDVEIAANSMTVPDISKSLEHSVIKAFVVWSTKKGTLTNLDKIDENKIISNKSFIAFKEKISVSLGKKAITIWASKTGWHNNIARWDVAIKSISPTLSRGAQIGLARGIEKIKGQWVEMGLLSNLDAATWRMNAKDRMIWSGELDNHPIAPLSYIMSKWPMPPMMNTPSKKGFNPAGLSLKEKNNKVSPSKNEQWGMNNDLNRILWCTKSSLTKFGKDNLSSWWEWFSKKGKGVVVFDSLDSQEQRDMFSYLKKENTAYQRWLIYDETKVVFTVWWINIFEERIATKNINILDWVGEAPAQRKNEKLNMEDEFGRVPYRALSQLNKSEGMAPKRLEQSIHKALTELSYQKGDVDKLISDLLHVKRKKLPESLSAEQIDAISLAISAFEKRSGMILADETGFGKGRILAALAIIGLKLGKKVIFFTEKSQLFTDFFRDIADVINLDKVDIMPTVLHGTAKIYDQEGNIIKKSLTKSKMDEMLNTPTWGKKEDKIILSTYSQINRPGKGNPKMKWLVERIQDGDCWLLLDEAHNAAGDSNISENLDTLLEYSEGVLYSSATFAKSEQNLSLYKKALAIEEWVYGLIESTMLGDDGALREALTISMASKGRFIRREHPPVPPPQPIWVEMTEERKNAVNLFSVMWRQVFEATQAWEVAMGNHGSAAWMKVGSILSRSIKEFSLLIKSDALINEVEEIVKRNEKVVIVVQSTFEGALKSILGEMEEDDEESEEVLEGAEGEDTKKKKKVASEKILDHIPLWKERMLSILNMISPQEDLDEIGDEEEVILAKQSYAKAVKAIEQLPDWDLMPFEKIKRALNEKGIEVGELSGRTLTVKEENDKWIIHARKSEPRTELVRRFNNGELDVAIVTLAGCSGISMHAGKKFKDQRKRNLIEADIAVNPANRVQFWGRVRRKDQVCEPNMLGLVLDTLGDRRIIAKENKKREKLSAHVGMKQESRELDWITPEGESLVAEWAMERQYSAKMIGVSKPVLDEPTGRVDKALVRSIILPEEEQEGLLSRLERGLKIAQDVAFKDRNSSDIKNSRVVRRGWLWGHPQRSEDNERGDSGPLSMPRIDYVERVIEKTIPPKFDDILKTVKERQEDPDFNYFEGTNVLERWGNSWAEEARKGVVTTTYRRSIWDWVSRVLPYSLCGNAIRVSRPGTGEAVWGIILSVYAPEEGGNVHGASPWALSQVGLEVWLIGEEDPLIISLSRCYSDNNFLVNGHKASASWFKADVISHTCITIEGNPLLAGAWGKKWSAGRPTLIRDDEKGIIWVWMLPGTWTWDVMENLPKDLIDVEHTVKFLYDNPNVKITAALPSGKVFNLIPKQGAIILQMSNEMENFSKETWINFKNNQYMKNRVWKDGLVERTIEWKSIKYILHAMEKAGIKWRIDAKYKDWYYKTSKEIMESIIKSKNKVLAAPVKKQYSRK